MKEQLRQAMFLRDKAAVDTLAQEIEWFEPEMLALDFQNWNNRNFVCYIIDKYDKKFNWKEEAVCEAMFDIACELEDKKLIGRLMKQKKAISKYALLAGKNDDLFKLASKIKVEELENDAIVEFIVQAAMSEKAGERLAILKDKGFVPTSKTNAGQTAAEVLAERLSNEKYDKNRSGSVKRQSDKNALQYLERWEAGLIKEEKKPFPWNIVLPVALAVVVLVSVGIGVGVKVAEKKEQEKLMKEAEQNMQNAQPEYNTDTSLVVKDGDTVNIDYVGSVDGVEFDGGNTNGMGTQLVIGSGSYIDDFEQQLIGHNVGETVKVEVTFPENYGQENLNGKDAVFEVVINGIYE